jgi:hypothetical protein
MADDVNMNSTDAVIAADNISSVFYQRIKIKLGADGEADCDVDAGQQLSTASLPVVLASDKNVQVQGGMVTPSEYLVVIAAADTEYPQALPSNTQSFEFQCRQSMDVRWSFSSSRVATPTTDPYQTLKAGLSYWRDSVKPTTSPLTLYFAADATGDVEMLAWTT